MGFSLGGILGALRGVPAAAKSVGNDIIHGPLTDGLKRKMRDGGEYEGMDRSNFDLPGYAERDERIRGWQDQMMGRQALQASDSKLFRGQQIELGNLLMQQARGENSLAKEQFRQMTDRGIAQQQALAASARPGQGAMAARQAAQNAAGLTQGMAGQAAMAGLAERQAASQALGGLLGQARGQDINTSQFNAGMNLSQQQLNQQGLLDLIGKELAQAGMQQAGGMGYEGQRTARYGAALGVPTVGEGVLSALGPLGTLLGLLGSDRELKRDVRPAAKEADALLAALRPQRFQYKDPATWGQGPRLGIMAQDLERVPLARAAVMSTPAGKVIATPAMTGALAAALGRLNERVTSTENQLATAKKAPR